MVSRRAKGQGGARGEGRGKQEVVSPTHGGEGEEGEGVRHKSHIEHHLRIAEGSGWVGGGVGGLEVCDLKE